MQKNIGIINYGVGNHSSVVSSIKSLGHIVTLSKKIGELEKCDILLLPGVGSFPIAMKGLENFGLIKFIKKWVKKKSQLLVSALVCRLWQPVEQRAVFVMGWIYYLEKVIKISSDKTHIGWNSLRLNQTSNILKDYKEKDFYFNHSYILKTNTGKIIATAKFEGDIPAVVISDNIVGLQFHPEKSQKYGSTLLGKIIDGF